MAVVTADHIMHPVAAFRRALRTGFALAEDRADLLVTFGVVPTSPHTGYGYLRRGAALPGHPEACLVAEFKEKPDRPTAEAYLASGEYWWNSGMFVWRAATLLDQLAPAAARRRTPRCTELAAAPERLDEIYPGLLKISVDYAVMEPASPGPAAGARGRPSQLPITWHDVGGFAVTGEPAAARRARQRPVTGATRGWSTRGTTW